MKRLIFISFVAIAMSIIFTSVSSARGNNASRIKFSFDGLQALCFGDSTRVSDGILNVAHHTPKIEIKKIDHGKETIVNTITADQLKNHTINISTTNQTSKPTRYYSADMSKDTNDFRWCIDLESDVFQKQLYLKEDKLFAKIHFNAGVFTASNLSTEKYKLFAGETQHAGFNREIAEPAGSITLDQGSALQITGLEQNISLPAQDGVDYAIAITNLPPLDHANLNHFLFYYDYLGANVPKFMLVETKKANYFPRPVVCNAIILSKSIIN